MEIVFMGTPDIAKAVLQSIFESKHKILAVVTQPDKPKGRGNEIVASPVKQYAVEQEIPVYQPVTLKDEEFMEILRSLKPELIIVAAFGQLLTREVLAIPKFGCINVHASLLPKYRGAAPIQRCIIDGEIETGITIMQMDAGIDTGDMLDKAVIPIALDETGGSLHNKLAKEAGPLLLKTLGKLENGSLQPEKQDDKTSNYAAILTKAEGNIDFSKSAVEIERRIRGMTPWPSAYTKWNGKTLKFWSASAETENLTMKTEPGTVCLVSKEVFYVKTGDGLLKLMEVQLEGKKRMSSEEFLRGYSLKEGTILRKE